MVQYKYLSTSRYPLVPLFTIYNHNICRYSSIQYLLMALYIVSDILNCCRNIYPCTLEMEIYLPLPSLIKNLNSTILFSYQKRNEFYGFTWYLQTSMHDGRSCMIVDDRKPSYLFEHVLINTFPFLIRSRFSRYR